MSKSERTISDAREIAAELKAAGRHQQAETILRLCRSNSALRETASRLSADNMALRSQIKRTRR